jgi:transcriptional regulator
VTSGGSTLVPLFLLIILGIFAVRTANLTWTGWPPLPGFGSATLVLFFAFGSAEEALSPSGEIRDPARTIPRGILGGALFVVMLCVAVHVVVQGVLGRELALGTTTPLAEAAERLVGVAGKGLILAATAVSVFGNLAADMICTPRTFLAPAESGLLPRALSRVHPTFHTPWVAILVYAGIGVALSLSCGFRPLAVLASISLLLVYLAVCLAALRIRYSLPQLPGAFRAPGGPTIALLASLGVLWLLAQSTRREVVAMAVVIATATLYYVIRRRLAAPGSGPCHWAEAWPGLTQRLPPAHTPLHMSQPHMTATNLLDRELKKGSTELLVMSLVEERARHGYEIGRIIEQRSGGVVQLHVASLYPLLYRLEKRGWVAGRWVERAGERRRRFYRLTPSGRKVLDEQRETWQRFAAAVRRVARLRHA